MYEITKYVCEEDGKEFDTEKECLKYERELKYGAVIANNELRMWDEDFKPTTELGDIEYFMCSTTRAFDYLKDLNDDVGICAIDDLNSIKIEQLYVYDCIEDEYVSFDDYSSNVRKIAKAFGIKLDEANQYP